MSESVSYYIKLLRSMADYEKQLSAYHAKNLFELAAGHSRRSDALLAGAEALERLEAMESASSAMLPKSASVSEVPND